MVTQYPANIDTTVTLPKAIDNVTPVQGSIFNNLRDAVISIESELGTSPSSVYGTIKARLNFLENNIGGSQTLAEVLATGNTTDNDNIILSTGTELVLNQNASVPSLPGSGSGALWVKSTSPTTLIFTDSSGADTTLGSGGGGGSQTLAEVLALGNATSTNNIILSSGAEILFNQNASVPSAPGSGKGALWVKSTSPTTLVFTDSTGIDTTLGSGSQTLTQVLALGNTTGTNNIVLSTGAEVLFNQNASVPSAPGAAKGALWVKSTSPTTLIFTNSVGTDTTLGASTSQTLAQTLALGNTTSTNNIIISTGAEVLFNQNASVPSAPGAGNGALWVKNTSPTTLIYTNSVGTDTTLGASTSQTLAQTLALGNTTSTNNIIISTGAEVLFNQNASVPSAPGAGNGALWVKNTSPTTLIFTNSVGSDTTLGSGGGGSQTLAQTLVLGNTTDGYDIVISADTELLFNESSVVPTTPTTGEGALWIKDTAPTTLIFTDSDGIDTTLGSGGGSQTLEQTLVLGNTTGTNNIVLSTGAEILFNQNSSVPSAPGAAKGALWVKNSSPTTLIFTNSVGTDTILGSGGGGGGSQTLGQTLALGNSSDGYDIIMSDGDLLTSIAAAPSSDESGHTLNIQAGSGDGIGSGGSLRLFGGPAGTGTGAGGGGIDILAADAAFVSDAGVGGTIFMSGGNINSGTGDAGGLIIIAGSSFGTAGNGGTVILSSGSAIGAGNGGDCTITSGQGGSGQIAGNVIIGASGSPVTSPGKVHIVDSAESLVPVISVDVTGLSFFNIPTVAQQTVTGSQGGNTALASLLTALAAYGIIIDTSTP